MTRPTEPLRRGGQFTQGVLGEIGQIAAAAAKEDQQGTWGVDGWIRLFHNLIDLQIRSSAAALQAAVAGPWWLQPTDVDADSEEEVELPEWTTQQRVTLEAEGPFTRVGRPEETLDPGDLEFEPEQLAPGRNRFTIRLRGDGALGANYEGDVVLRLNGTEPAATYHVVVGL